MLKPCNNHAKTKAQTTTWLACSACIVHHQVQNLENARASMSSLGQGVWFQDHRGSRNISEAVARFLSDVRLQPQASLSQCVVFGRRRGGLQCNRSSSSEASSVIRIAKRKNVSWWLLSFEALDQSRHSCQVPCREFDVVLSSCTRFTHETGDFFASKSHVEPVFRQVTRYDAERPERCVLVERPLGTEITGVGFDAKSHNCRCLLEIQLIQNDVKVSRISVDLGGFCSINSGEPSVTKFSPYTQVCMFFSRCVHTHGVRSPLAKPNFPITSRVSC